jgi:hypothetical protein
MEPEIVHLENAFPFPHNQGIRSLLEDTAHIYFNTDLESVKFSEMQRQLPQQLHSKKLDSSFDTEWLRSRHNPTIYRTNEDG